jgi:hypothetical protein
MEIGTANRRRYRIAVDRARLQKAEVGAGPNEGRIRCTAPLVGGIDEAWRVSFRSVQLEDSGFFRFRLEMGSNVVTFTAGTAQRGPDMLSELKLLDFLVDTVNAKASRESHDH